MRLIDAALGKTRTILLSLALVLVAGASIYGSIPKEAQPDIEIPVIYVRMHHEDLPRGRRAPADPSHGEGVAGGRGDQGAERPPAREEAGLGGAGVRGGFSFGSSDKARVLDVAKAELPDATDEPTVNEVNFSLPGAGGLSCR